MNISEQHPLPSGIEYHFTPEDMDAERFQELEPLLEELMSMPVDTPPNLRGYLDAWLELDARVHEARSQLRVQKARFTNDDEYGRRWEHFVSQVFPKYKEWDHRLGQRLLDSPALSSLQDTNYQAVLRKVRSENNIFCHENLALSETLDQQVSDYGEIAGDWLIEFDGQEHTYSAMHQFLMDADRDIRRQAWESRSARRFEDAPRLDQLWQQMFEARNQMAQNAGFEDFTAYIFEEKMRDYDREACFAFHELIEEEVVPVARELAGIKRQKLNLDSLRPWDIAADPDGHQRLTPFETVDELIAGVSRMFYRLDDSLGAQFDAICPHFDLEARPHKEQGGFMMKMPASRRPYIFGNISGIHSDINLLVHETGHALHYLAFADDPHKTHMPSEFSEVASMAMELFHLETLDEFYDEEQQKRAINDHMRNIVRLLPTIAAGDAFQHQLYGAPDHNIEERHDLWMANQRRFKPHIDRSGLPDDWLRTSWHQTLHFFVVPFYFIEYGFAQLGALQLAMNAEQDRQSTLESYQEALSLGANADTKTLYETAGTQFIPSRHTLRQLMGWVRQRLGF